MKSKFSLSQAFLIPACVFLVTFGLTAALLLAGFIALRESNKDGIFLLGAGLVFLVLTLSVVWHYVKVVRKIEIDTDGIVIRSLLHNIVFSWDEVKSIKLTGKEPERFWFTSMPMEAVSISAKDGLKEVAFVKYYSNMDELGTVLHFIKMKIAANETITAECFLPVVRNEPSVPDLSALQKFGGNHIMTLNGLVTYGSIGLVVWMLLFSVSKTPVYATLILSAVVLSFGPGFFGYQLHYFRLNGEFLVVKNHIWFWRQDAYLVKDIREIVFEEPHKMSIALRVITNNYESKLYPAGSLRTKSWLKLSEQLKAYGVKVRDEVFFE